MYITCNNCGLREHFSKYSVVIKQKKEGTKNTYFVLATCPNCHHKDTYTISI